jgi:hypothetical protein
MQEALDAVDHGDPTRAKREYQLGSMKCAFCDFKKQCWPADDPLRTYFKTLPPKSWPTDTSRLGDAGEVMEEIYSEFIEAATANASLERLEQELITIGLETGKTKFKFADGEVYEIKLYKSPKEHFKWKRSKM